MAQERVVAIKDVSDGVTLMGAQGDFRIHAVELNMTAVVFTGANAVETLIVQLNELLAAGLISPDPLLECIFDLLLFSLCSLRFLCIEYPAFCSVCIPDGVEDTDGAQIQAFFQNVIEVGPIGSVGDGGFDIATGVAFAGNIPNTGVRHIMNIHQTAGDHGSVHQFIGKLLDDRRGNPGGTQTHSNLAGFQIFGLYLLQSLYVDSQGWIGLGGQFCNSQLLTHIAGQVSICCVVNWCSIRSSLHRVNKDDTFQLIHKLLFTFAGQLHHVG